MGIKRGVLTGEKGLPFSTVLLSANMHDIKLLEITLDQTVIQRPKSSVRFIQNLCLDAGYTGSKGEVEKRGYIVHIRPRFEEKWGLLWNPDLKAWRQVVGVTHSFFDRFRELLVRFERKAANYPGLLHLAYATIIWRKLIRIRI